MMDSHREKDPGNWEVILDISAAMNSQLNVTTGVTPVEQDNLADPSPSTEPWEINSSRHTKKESKPWIKPVLVSELRNHC